MLIPYIIVTFIGLFCTLNALGATTEECRDCLYGHLYKWCKNSGTGSAQCCYQSDKFAGCGGDLDDECASTNERDHDSHLFICPDDYNTCGTQIERYSGEFEAERYGTKYIDQDSLCWYKFEYEDGQIDSFLLSSSEINNTKVGIYLAHKNDSIPIIEPTFLKSIEEFRGQPSIEYLYEFEPDITHEVNITKGDYIYILAVPQGRNNGSFFFSIEGIGEPYDSGSSSLTWIIIGAVVVVVIIIASVFIYFKCCKKKKFKISRPDENQATHTDEASDRVWVGDNKRDPMINYQNVQYEPKGDEHHGYIPTGYEPDLTASTDHPYNPVSMDRNSNKIN